MKKLRYPKDVRKYKQVYGHGGIRIYRVSRDEAKQIKKEFPADFRFSLPKGGFLFYMNINRGERHVIFSLPK
jgi:hypothetical protein